MSDEWKALLSAYAAGTLTDGEKKALFERAMADQALFDELMDTETMRAAMEGPLAKRALLHALEEEEEGSEAIGDKRYFDLEAAGEATPFAIPPSAAPPTMRAAKVAPIVVARKSRRGIWVALAACLVAGTFGAYVYFQRPADVYIAQMPKPKVVEVAQTPEESRVNQLATPAPQVAPAAPLAQSTPKAEDKVKAKVKDEEMRQEAPGAGVTGPMLAPPIPAAPASPAPPATAVAVPSEAKKVNEEVAMAAPASPQADAVLSLRDAEGGGRKESREKSVFGAARAVGSNVVPVARVVGRRLEIRGDAMGQLYVYFSEGARFRKVPGLAPMPLLRSGARSFALPDGVAGTLFVLIAPQRDAELDRLADPHEGPLPVRNWTRISFQ